MSKDIPNNSHKVSTLELELELLKYMHEPRTTKQLLDFTGFATNQQINDLFRYAKDGIKLNNVCIPFNKVRYSHNTFGSSGLSPYNQDNDGVKDSKLIEDRNTVHPVILPLNMTQVYLLTDHLAKITENLKEADEYKKIANMIKAQLSDYALSRLQKSDESLPQEITWQKEKENFLYLIKYLSCEDAKIEFITLHDTKGREIGGTAYSENGQLLFKPENSDKVYKIDEKTGKVIIDN